MLQVSQTSRPLDGVDTEVLIQAFADRIMVLVTQLGKVGTLIQARIPPTELLSTPPNALESAPSGELILPEPPLSIQLTPLLGTAPSESQTTLYSLYVSQIATIIWTYLSGPEGVNAPGGNTLRPVIVGLALKKPSTTTTAGQEVGIKDRLTFIAVMEMVVELLKKS